MITETTTLHVHHSLLCISSPSLHDYNVKVPNFTLCGGSEHKSTFVFLNFDKVFWHSIPEKLPFDQLNQLE